MIAPLLITGGILGLIAFAAPRVDGAKTDVAPAAPFTQQIEATVDPARYRMDQTVSDNPAREAYLALLHLGFANVVFAGTSDPDLSRFKAGTPVTFAFNVTGAPRTLELPSWLSLFFTGRAAPGSPPTSTPAPGQTPPSENLPPLPAAPATPPAGIPQMPTTQAQRLAARAEALLAQGMAGEPVILESLAGEIAERNPSSPYVGQLLQLAQAIRLRRAQEVP